ncbi:hypothetical protein [Nocardia sp. NBC_01009]|uniref:hypothetical protein n=1 Tax=Nocardia sp. NBC_01009 TaxID=2975996 RepID=UPI00386A6C3C|nr:hypothetical protein OHA42_17400 [Nocardia sp. NBC_01009]
MWFGYARMDLIGHQTHSGVADAMEKYADTACFGPGKVLFEPRAPEKLLRSMIEEADRRDPDIGIMARLDQVARARHLDLAQVFDAKSPRTQVLWELMEELEGHGGGHLVVPSWAHLTSLGPSGHAVVQRITRMKTAHIYRLDADDPVASEKPDAVAPLTVAPLTAAEEVVLVESPLDVGATLTRFDPIKVLTIRRWTDQVMPVDRLYKELVADSDRAAIAAGDLGFGPDGNAGVIRLLHRCDGLLVVELEETRHRADDPSAQLKAICAHADRFANDRHTITRCTLGREYAIPFEPVGVAS